MRNKKYTQLQSLLYVKMINGESIVMNDKSNIEKKIIKNNILVNHINVERYNLNHPEIYNQFEQKRLKNTIIHLLKYANNNENMVLDLGAGTGNLTFKFIQNNCHVTAADVSEKSLLAIKKKAPNELEIIKLDGEKLPFKDNTFDIVAVYSVLHHIPDYLIAVKEMFRILKPEGILYVDHEFNQNKWNKNKLIEEYYNLSKKSKFEEFFYLTKTGKLFTPQFIKSFFIKRFINPKYKTEGDIHVWSDDHIEWDLIKKTIFDFNGVILYEKDYLLYNSSVSIEIYDIYKDKCTDMKCIFFQKSK